MGFESAAFHAMGTGIELLGAPRLPGPLAEQVRSLFGRVEFRLSRFLPESELSQLNRSDGRPFRASALLRGVLRDALAAARSTGGLFDPTVLEAVEASGYRRSFDELNGVSTREAPATGADYGRVEIFDDGSVVLHGGVRVDLGGFAKGWTVDAAAGLMAGAGSWVVNAGGDLRAAGPGPDGDGWLVGIEDPWVPGTDIAVIRARDCAVATSSVGRRRWRTPEGWAHHLIDPRTGAPADTGLASVTVLAPTAAEAEVLAKTVLLLGRVEGARCVESAPGCGAALVSDRGDMAWTAGMEGLRAA